MRRSLMTTGLGLLLFLLGTSTAAAAAGPLYDIKVTWGDTNLVPGQPAQFIVQARNIGEADGAEEDLVIKEELPAGVKAASVYWGTTVDPSPPGSLGGDCKGKEVVTCTLPAAEVPKLAPAPGPHKSISVEPSGSLPTIYIDATVPAKASGEGTSKATIEGGGAAGPASDTDQVHFIPAPAPFGLVEGSFLSEVFSAAYPAGAPVRQASDRPFELRVSFDLNARTGKNETEADKSRYITSSGQLRTVEATLPRGMVANPEATPKCDPSDFVKFGTTLSSTACPSNTQVGYLNVSLAEGVHNFGRGNFPNVSGLLNRVPVYNLEPPKGFPADLAFNAGGVIQGHIYGIPDPAQSYAIKSLTPNISNGVTVRGSEVTIWGVPGDPAHDKFRYPPGPLGAEPAIGAPFGGAPVRPFLTNPMDCGFHNGGTRIRVDSYEHPDQFTGAQEYGDPLEVSGCDDPRFRFEPDITLQPTDVHAGAPTGLDVHLNVPQRNDEAASAKDLYAPNENVKAIATPPVKKAVVTFPQGMTISPSAAQGLQGCTEAQIGLGTDAPVKCPDASQYGTLTLHTPIFPADAPLRGFLYIAKQSENPFHSFLALYMVIQEPNRGILVKIPARAELDPQSGQITTTFDDLPQFPVSDLQLSFKGGVRGALVNPTTCGTKTITAELFSWQDPGTPHVVNSNYQISERPDGSPCVQNLSERPFAPKLTAGTQSNTAGSFSPFLMRLTRSDDDQEFSQLRLKLPAGLTAKLAGLGRCSDAGIAQAGARTGAGQGALEQADPSCPASSLIGTTEVGAGVGVPLTYVPGKVYLAGSYHGSPLSVVVITPAVVGPYDLGVIAVRSALDVDSETARATVLTDPFPQIFQGIPVRIRDIRVNLDRQNFTLNPTSCAEKHFDARITGTGGNLASTADDTAAELTDRFQAAECASLAFKPKLSFRLIGGTRRGAHPGLRASFKGRGGDANLAGASVALPHSEFLDQAHIKTVCTRVQFAAHACPPGSVYGQVTATSPLFDETFSGPLYLRSSSHPLPDLVAALKGPASLPVEVDLVGRVDSVNGGIRNTFEVIPDVPVSSALFTFQGAKKGLLVNSTNLCSGSHRATAKFTAQSGRKITLRPELKASCGSARHGHRRR